MKYRRAHSKSAHLQSHILEYKNPVAEEMNEKEDKASLAGNEGKEEEIELAATLNIYVDPKDEKNIEGECSMQNESEDVVLNIEVTDPPLDSPVHLETESGKPLMKSD